MRLPSPLRKPITVLCAVLALGALPLYAQEPPPPQSPNPLSNEGRLPEIKALLEKDLKYAALIGKPLPTITEEEWNLIEKIIPEVEADQVTLAALFKDSADVVHARLAAEKRRDKDAKDYNASHAWLKQEQAKLAEKLKGLNLAARKANHAALKTDSLKLNKKLLDYVNSGKADDLASAVSTLEGIYNNAGMTGGDVKAKALTEVGELTSSGGATFVKSADGSKVEAIVYSKVARLTPDGIEVPAVNTAKKKDEKKPEPGQKHREDDERMRRLDMVYYAALGQLPGIPKGVKQKADREYFKASAGFVTEARTSPTWNFLETWSAQDKDFAKLAKKLTDHEAKLETVYAIEDDKKREKAYNEWVREHRLLLRQADAEIETLLARKKELMDTKDPALKSSLAGYLASRTETAVFYSKYLQSGSAGKGTAFLEEELTPFRRSKLSRIVIEDYDGKRGARQYYDDGSTVFRSNDGSLAHNTGKTDAKYNENLGKSGTTWSDAGGTYDERVEYRRGKVDRRLVTLTTGGGEKAFLVTDYFDERGALLDRTSLDYKQGLETIISADGSVVLVSTAKSRPWSKQKGKMSPKGEFVADIMVSAANKLTFKVETEFDDAGKIKSQTAYYRPVDGLKGAPDDKLQVSVFSVDASMVRKPAGEARMEAVKKFSEAIGNTPGWDWGANKRNALAGFLHERVDHVYLNSSVAAEKESAILVTREGEASIVSAMEASQGKFVMSPSRGKAEDALIMHRFTKSGKGWSKSSNDPLQVEFFGDWKYLYVTDMIDNVETDDGVLEKMTRSVATLKYEYKAGEWKVTGADKLAEYTVYERPSRWAEAAKKLGNVPGISHALDLGKSAVNFVGGGIKFGIAGVADLAGEDKFADHMQASAWATWGDVPTAKWFGKKAMGMDVKQEARELTEENIVAAHGIEDFNSEVIDRHKKALSWEGDGRVYGKIFGDSAVHNQDMRNAYLDSHSLEKSTEFFFDECEKGGASYVWCGVGAFTGASKAFMEMPIMVGGAAVAEIKLAGLVAKTTQWVGGGANAVSTAYTATSFTINAANMAQMAAPLAVQVVEAVQACRDGEKCATHVGGVLMAAGNLGGFKYMYGKGVTELNIKFGAKDAKWMADLAVKDMDAGNLKLGDDAKLVLQKLALDGKAPDIEGLPARYKDRPQFLVADLVFGEVKLTNVNGKLFAMDKRGVIHGQMDNKPKDGPAPDEIKVEVDPTLYGLKKPVGESAERAGLDRGNALFSQGKFDEAFQAYAKWIDEMTLSKLDESPTMKENFKIAESNIELVARKALGAADGEFVVFHGVKDMKALLPSKLKGCTPPRCWQGGRGLYTTTRLAYALRYAGIGPQKESGSSSGMVALKLKPGTKIVDVDTPAVEKLAYERTDAAFAKDPQLQAERKKGTDAYANMFQAELTKVIAEKYGDPPVVRLKNSIGENLGYDEILVRDPSVLMDITGRDPITMASKGDIEVEPLTFPKKEGDVKAPDEAVTVVNPTLVNDAQTVVTKNPFNDATTVVVDNPGVVTNQNVVERKAPDFNGPGNENPTVVVENPNGKPTMQTGSHNESSGGSVEERGRQTSADWQWFKVDKYGRPEAVGDGHVELVDGQVLGRRSKKDPSIVELDGEPQFSTRQVAEERMRAHKETPPQKDAKVHEIADGDGEMSDADWAALGMENPNKSSFDGGGTNVVGDADIVSSNDVPDQTGTQVGKRNAVPRKKTPPEPPKKKAVDPVDEYTVLEEKYKDFSIKKFGKAQGRDFVIMEDIEPGATLRIRSGGTKAETDAVRKELVDMGFKVLDGEGSAVAIAQRNKRMKDFYKLQNGTFAGRKGADYLAGGDYSMADGGTIQLRGSRDNGPAVDALAADLEGMGFKVEVSKTDLIENHKPDDGPSTTDNSDLEDDGPKPANKTGAKVEAGTSVGKKKKR